MRLDAKCPRCGLLQPANLHCAGCGVTPLTGVHQSPLRDVLVDRHTGAYVRTLGLSTSEEGRVVDALKELLRQTEDARRVQQVLFESYADLNLDWWEIAVTEWTWLKENLRIAEYAEGSRVRYLAPPDCPACTRLAGRRMVIVNPAGMNKNPKTELWVGKCGFAPGFVQYGPEGWSYNEGMLARNIAEPPVSLHPAVYGHCPGGFWERLPDPPKSAAEREMYRDYKARLKELGLDTLADRDV